MNDIDTFISALLYMGMSTQQVEHALRDRFSKDKIDLAQFEHGIGTLLAIQYRTPQVAA